MELAYIFAGLVAIMLIAMILKEKFNPEKDENKDEATYAKEIVDRMIVTETIEDEEEKDNKEEVEDGE